MSSDGAAAGRARWVGRGVLAVLAAILVMNLGWVARHAGRLRPISRGDVAQSVPLPRVDGRGPLALADLKGQVVLVDFWATWCGPCEQTIPMQQRLHEKYAARGFAVWSVNQDAGGAAGAAVARRYAERKGLPFPVVHDGEGLAAALYKVDVFPTMMLVDRLGVIRQVHIGVPSVSRLERQLDEGIRALL